MSPNIKKLRAKRWAKPQCVSRGRPLPSQKGSHRAPEAALSSPGALSYKQRLDCTLFCKGDLNAGCSSLAFPPKRVTLKTVRISREFQVWSPLFESTPQTIQPKCIDTLLGHGKAIKVILVKHLPCLNLCLSFHPFCRAGSTR